MSHVVLLGDSILDNGAYVSGGSPVIEQLQSRLPREWKATLLARDGAIATTVLNQLQRMPADTSHLVLSAGGNDALESSSMLNSPESISGLSMLKALTEAQQQFQQCYSELIRTIQRLRIPAVGCTIYEAVPGLQPVERMALSLFNDIIVRELHAARFAILDLRAICTDKRDYSSVSPIEPSEIGGSKIARQIHSIVLSHDWTRGQSTLYP